ncbi:Uncharacterized protein QTN25_008386 [Entamoeba marina]
MNGAPPFNNEKENQNNFSTLRNLQTQQQAVMLGFLNLCYDIHIDHPTKRSVVTLPFLKVSKLINGNEVIHFSELVEKTIQNIYENELTNGVKKKTATRRLETNRIVEHLQLLINFLSETNVCQIQTSKTGKKGLKQNIVGFTFDDFVMTKKDIESVGTKINKAIMGRMKGKSSTVKILKGDTEFMAILVGAL